MKRKYQIFISSTYEDLKEERRAVQDAILAMYHFPVGMELFGATSNDQWKVITDTIDSSDYYVLIMAHRYGTLIPDGEDKGISYTEKEFRYARDAGIPILAFIRNENSGSPKYVDRNANLANKLEHFKKEASTGRNVEFWDTKETLATKVTQSLYKEFDNTPRKGWARLDEYNPEESQAEILRLHQEVSALREENAGLKAQLFKRKPELTVGFVLAEKPEPSAVNPTDNPMEDEIYSHEELLLENDENGLRIQHVSMDLRNLRDGFKPLRRSALITEPEISRMISDAAIARYNKELPSDKEIDAYIREYEQYGMIFKGGLPFDVQIENVGTAIANNVKIIFTFPEEIALYDVDDVADMKEPKKPKMPPDIIAEAEKEYESQFDPMAQYVHALSQTLPHIISPYANDVLPVLSDKYVSRTEHIYIEGHEVEIRCERIQHRDHSVLEGLYLVPTKRGSYRVTYEIMCDEFAEPVCGEMNVEVG